MIFQNYFPWNEITDWDCSELLMTTPLIMTPMMQNKEFGFLFAARRTQRGWINRENFKQGFALDIILEKCNAMKLMLKNVSFFPLKPKMPILLSMKCDLEPPFTTIYWDETKMSLYCVSVLTPSEIFLRSVLIFSTWLDALPIILVISKQNRYKNQRYNHETCTIFNIRLLIKNIVLVKIIINMKIKISLANCQFILYAGNFKVYWIWL